MSRSRDLEKRILLLVVIVLAFVLAGWRMAQQPQPSLFQPTIVKANGASAPFFHSGFASHGQTRLVHAPSLVELSDDRLLAFWFAGTREGAGDVVIASAFYDPLSMRWGPTVTVTNVTTTVRAEQRFLRKLGNPVVTRDAAGKLWLFYVSALGGWSTSSINWMTSVDEGRRWSQPRRLITSPFLNISTLAKSVPFFYQDGTLGLPIYHEMAGKFAELLRIDQQGRVVDKQRLSHGRVTLQPLLLIESARDAVALLRYSGPLPRMARQLSTADGGVAWSRAKPSSLPNPDSAMAGVVVADGGLLTVLNHNQSMRDDLTLLRSDDHGNQWRVLYQFEDQRRWRGHIFTPEQFLDELLLQVEQSDRAVTSPERVAVAASEVMCSAHPCWFQYDYPYMIQARDGTFHLLYTWNRSYIKHIQFNHAWLDEGLPRKQRQQLVPTLQPSAEATDQVLIDE